MVWHRGRVNDWYGLEHKWSLLHINSLDFLLCHWIDNNMCRRTATQKLFLIKLHFMIGYYMATGWPRGAELKISFTKLSRWWSSGKNLGPRYLLSLWSQVRALWLLIWWSLEAYMVVNFRARGISRDTYKLVRTSTLN
jgi:hypothetical protein